MISFFIVEIDEELCILFFNVGPFHGCLVLILQYLVELEARLFKIMKVNVQKTYLKSPYAIITKKKNYKLT